MKFLTLALLCLASCVHAQECDKIEKQIDEMKGITSYQSPITKRGCFYWLKVKKESKESTGLVLSLFDIVGDYAAKGVYVKFDDGQIIKDEQKKVNCDYEDRSKYRYEAVLEIDDAEIDDFINKKVVKIQLDNISKQLTDKETLLIQSYAKCIKESK